MDVDAGAVSLFEVQGWAGYSPIDGHASSGISGDVDLLLCDREVVLDGKNMKRILYHRCDSKANTPIIAPAIVTL